MRLLAAALLLLTFGPGMSLAASDSGLSTYPKVLLQTNLGNIVIELDSERAPKTVQNFLGYVEEGAYDGTIFHRVIDNFMIQGGGYTEDYQRKPTHEPVRNEADNGLKNLRGSIAMARTSDPHSATAQFFINVVDNSFLDFTAKTNAGWGYTVFGRVVEGMEVVDKIKSLPTGHGGPFPKDVPQTPVVIEKAILVSSPEPDAEAQTEARLGGAQQDQTPAAAISAESSAAAQQSTTAEAAEAAAPKP
jgi:peptidyl-prolyl cis-trans isomerase B (cyclophilin B)